MFCFCFFCDFYIYTCLTSKGRNFDVLSPLCLIISHNWQRNIIFAQVQKKQSTSCCFLLLLGNKTEMLSPLNAVIVNMFANSCLFSHTATRSFMYCHVSGPLMNLSQIFTLFLLCFWSLPTPQALKLPNTLLCSPASSVLFRFFIRGLSFKIAESLLLEMKEENENYETKTFGWKRLKLLRRAERNCRVRWWFSCGS